MRMEDLDVRGPSVLDITPDEADRMREEYEAREQTKAERKARERAQLTEAVRIAQRRLAEQYAEQLAEDVAWARAVLPAGETFRSGDAFYAALYAEAKRSGQAMTFTVTNRLRRVVVALSAEFVATEAA